MARTSKKTESVKEPSKIYPAYFTSLEIENFLCFKDKQVLDLSDKNGNPARWTVILGDNGVGKTTLLRCLGCMEIQQTGEWAYRGGREDHTPIYKPIIASAVHQMRIWNWKTEEQLKKLKCQIKATISLRQKIDSMSINEKIIKNH